MPDPLPNIAIIGAGVSGLSCGVWLAANGFPVTIYTKDHHEELVSRKAAAIWFPYKAKPQKLIEALSFETLDDLRALLQAFPQAGVAMELTQMVFTHQVSYEDEPVLVGLKARAISENNLPSGYLSGWEFKVPFIDTSIYMPFLLSLFKEHGGKLIHQHISRLDELAHFPIIINCSGLGAKQLCQDELLFPIRGQVVRMSKPTTSVFLIDESDEDRPGYIFSRSRDCIVGGSAESGRDDLKPSLAMRRDILERAAGMLPSLKKATFLDDAVGLRPGRSQLKLAAEKPAENRVLIHNYGHGGSGFTISWGCARRVVQWVSDHAQIPMETSTPLPVKSWKHSNPAD